MLVVTIVVIHNLYAQKDRDCKKNEKVTLFGTKLQSKKIAGGCFGNSSHFYRSSINPTLADGKEIYLNQLGSYRSHYSLMEKHTLFNLSYQNDFFPTLDSIDIAYYDAVGIDLLPKEITEKPNFITFLNDWKKPNLTVVDKRKLLNSNTDIRKELAKTRYTLTVQNTFVVDEKTVSTKTAEIKAKLDTIKINASTDVAGQVRAYLYSLADKHIEIKGQYVLAELHDAYISRIIGRFKGKNEELNGRDPFSINYNIYRGLEEAAINTGLVAMGVGGKYNDKEISIQSVSAELRAKFTSLPETDYARIAASLSLTFDKSRTTILSVDYSSLYVLRYFTHLGLDTSVGILEAKSLDPTGTVLINKK